jgi:hypothetical protein
MTTLILPDEIREHVTKLQSEVDAAERNAATWADRVMILRSEKDKLEHRLEEMAEARDELKKRVDLVEPRWIPVSVVAELDRERDRQEEKFPGQVCPNGTGSTQDRPVRGIISARSARLLCQEAFTAGEGTWGHVLVEEVAEALEETETPELRKELLQVAAVCLRWIAQLDVGGRHG